MGNKKASEPYVTCGEWTLAEVIFLRGQKPSSPGSAFTVVFFFVLFFFCFLPQCFLTDDLPAVLYIWTPLLMFLKMPVKIPQDLNVFRLRRWDQTTLLWHNCHSKQFSLTLEPLAGIYILQSKQYILVEKHVSSKWNMRRARLLSLVSLHDVAPNVSPVGRFSLAPSFRSRPPNGGFFEEWLDNLWFCWHIWQVKVWNHQVEVLVFFSEKWSEAASSSWLRSLLITGVQQGLPFWTASFWLTASSKN